MTAFRLAGDHIVVDGLFIRQSAILDLYQIFSNTPILFHQAIEDGTIIPFFDNHQWYMGPHRNIFWHRGIYHLHEVQKRMAIGKRMPYIANTRRQEVAAYLKTLNST